MRKGYTSVISKKLNNTNKGRGESPCLNQIKFMHKSLITFHNSNYASRNKKVVVKQFNDEKHEDNYIAYMKRLGYILDEVYEVK